MIIERIRKVRSCKHADLTKVATEIALISTLMLNPVQAMQSNYHIHKVPVAGRYFMVADAKFLNRYTNQSGRGNMRYLFDLQTRIWEGLAQEIDNGSYRRVA